MSWWKGVAPAGFLLLAACFSPIRTGTRPGTDFSQIKSVLVLEPEIAPERAVTDEFSRQLLERGYRVKVGGPGPGADVWLQVTVTQITPDRKYLVPLQNKPGRETFVLNPVTEISGRSLYPSGTGASLEDAQILVSNASLSLSVRLLTPDTRELLWTGSVTYEGLDLDVAVEGSVASLFKKFPLK